ncbi:MAG TPA: hypothetical protein VD994_02055 [Prosthecobacter sp.]|nr:hypothetical protein [Prosthecobacter sp.]
MKKILAVLLTLAVSSVALVPTAAEARHSDSRRVAYHCRSCGDSVYQERYYRGRDHYGRPIFGWRTVSHRCRYDRHRGHGHGHGHHHGHGHQGHGSHFSGAGFHLRIGR